MKTTPVSTENFWNSVVMTIGSAIVALGAEFPTDQAKVFVSMVFGLIIAGNFFINYFKDLEVRGKFTDIFKSTNFRLQLLSTAAIVLPYWLPSDAISGINELVGAILEGKIEFIAVAAFGVIRTFYNLFKNRPKPEVITS